MLNELRVSVMDANLGDGTVVPSRAGKTGEQMVADAAPRYYDLVKRGVVFTAANTAVKIHTLNNTTATGLILTNPVGSSKNLVLLDVCVALASVPVALSEVCLTGDNTGAATTTHTNALTVRNALFGAGRPTSVAFADDVATMSAVTVFRSLGSYLWIATAANVAFTQAALGGDLAGIITLGPGTSISIQAITTAISAVSSMTWAELPV